MTTNLSHLESVYIAGRSSDRTVQSHSEVVYIAGRSSDRTVISHSEVVFIMADPTYIPFDPSGVKQRRITSLMIN